MLFCHVSGGNAEVVSIWGSESGSYMQAVHFCFSLGGVIAPFIAEPFLAERKMDITQLNSNSSSSVTDVSCDNNMENGTETYTETSVEYAYVISAGLVLLTVVPFLCLYYMKRNDKIRFEGGVVDQNEPTDFHAQPLGVKVFLLFLLASLMCVYCGTEDTYAGYLMSFLTSELCWSKANGSLATSVYWICFGGARLLCIPLVRYVQTYKLLITFSTLLAISYAGLLFATSYKLSFLIWICIGAPGVTMSIIFPALFTWTNDNLVNVSGKISSLMMTSASVGIMSFPLLFGYTMEHFTQMWFVYLLFGQSVLWVFLFIFTLIAAKFYLVTSKTAVDTIIITKETLDENETDQTNFKVINACSETTYF